MTITQQQIIALAVEAGLAEVTDTAESLPVDYVEALAKFAALACQRGVRDERERCVKAFEKEADSWKAWPQAGAAKRKGVAAIYARNENANSATIPPIINQGVKIMAGKNGRERSNDKSKDTGGKDKKK